MFSQANERVAARRRVIYLSAAAALCLLYLPVRASSWHGTTQLHTLIELATTLLAFIVGMFALVRFYSKKVNTVLFLAAGFLGTALLDGCHAVVSSPGFKQILVSPPPSLIPWSGFASRFFLAVLLFLSWAFWKREDRSGARGAVREWQVYGIAAACVLACFTLFVLYPLPLAYKPLPFFHRPQELVPAAFFLLALIGYARKAYWKRDPFEHWLMLALIFCLAQAFFMSTSDSLYDGMYIASHSLKLLAYASTLTGLLTSVYYLFLMEESVLSERTQKLRQEVSERKRAEEESRDLLHREQLALQKIRDARTFADMILEAMPMICAIFNDQGRPLRWNRHFEEVLGFSSNQVPHLNMLDTVTEPFRDRIRATIQEALAAGSSQAEACLITKNNPCVPHYLYSARVVLDGKTCLAGAAIDISASKQAEAQLHLQSAALNSAANAIVITNAQGTIQWVNPSFTRLTGYSLEEAVGQNPRILKSGKQEEPFYRDLWTSILAGKIWHSEVTNRKKSGEFYVEEMTIAPVRSATGEITNFVAIKQDVTERKRAQVELAQAKELAETANRAKSEFLANMSHELRTPLNGIMGMTELALRTELNPEQREYLTMSKTSAEGLLSLINEILDLSKIEAGKMEFESIDFNLRNSLEATIKVLAPRAHEKGLELNFHLQPDVPEAVKGDPGRLRQIVVNLVGNAIKFTGHGEVTLAVEVQSTAGPNVVLHFLVTDTGIGIPEDRRELIFDAFAQADGSTTRRYGGSGLGLTISRRLVEMFGGRLWLESIPGRGSTFHFTAQLAMGKATEWTPPSAGIADLQGLPTLVVDDNLTNRRILEDMLRGWCMSPHLTDGGAAALEALRHAAGAGTPYRLLLVDAFMPQMDGFTLVERIKGDPLLGAPVIMMLSSAAQVGDAARCRRLGIAAYLTKPIGRTELLSAIRLVLGVQTPPTAEPALVTRHSLREHQHGLRILLAEDNLVNRMVAVRLLEKQGYTVEVGVDGREALAKATSANFDLILMDVQMPEMDGFEATAAIRAQEEISGRHVPIIAMTAHALKGDRERCLAAGMDGYISKPFKIEELLEQVENLPQPVASGAKARATSASE